MKDKTTAQLKEEAKKLGFKAEEVKPMGRAEVEELLKVSKDVRIVDGDMDSNDREVEDRMDQVEEFEDFQTKMDI